VAREMTCQEVWANLSEFVDGETNPVLRRLMEQHLERCKHCTAVLDGTRNVVKLAADPRSFAMPHGFSDRLQSRLEDQVHALAPGALLQANEMELGITHDRVPHGSHLLYFFENDVEFQAGVRFLMPGIANNEHGIIFGHDEAIARVKSVLRAHGFDPEQLIADRKLTVLRRHAAAHITLNDFRDVMDAALRAGASGIRWLGNLGCGRDPLPAGEDDVAMLEHQASDLISTYPCVIVCMYDVTTLPGTLIMKGGLRQHPVVACMDGIHQNPHCVPERRQHGIRLQ
jgi:hypothetical protein